MATIESITVIIMTILLAIVIYKIQQAKHEVIAPTTETLHTINTMLQDYGYISSRVYSDKLFIVIPLRKIILEVSIEEEKFVLKAKAVDMKNQKYILRIADAFSKGDIDKIIRTITR